MRDPKVFPRGICIPLCFQVRVAYELCATGISCQHNGMLMLSKKIKIELDNIAICNKICKEIFFWGGWEVVMQFYTALNNISNFHLYSSKTVKMLKVASRKDNLM